MTIGVYFGVLRFQFGITPEKHLSLRSRAATFNQLSLLALLRAEKQVIYRICIDNLGQYKSG